MTNTLLSSSHNRWTHDRRRDSSRHRDSISSNAASLSSTMTNSHRLDENDHEMYSGAASEIVPSSISSFHHFNQHNNNYRSPRFSTTSHRPSEVEEDLELDNDLGLVPVSSNHSIDFSERSNFRFFTAEEIESAKGSSSMQYTGYSDNPIDYDTNWNTYEEDYAEEAASYREGITSVKAQRRANLNATLGDYGSTGGSDEERFIDDNGSSRLLYESDSEEHTRQNTKHVSAADYDKYFANKFSTTNHSQRFYIAEEDLVVGIAGYSTSTLKLILYYFICISTCGLGYLFLRWLPHYRISLMGNPTPLGKAEWVVIETEFGELDIINVDRQWYNRTLSTFLPKSMPKNEEHPDQNKTFGDSSLDGTPEAEYDSDPIVPILISLDWRYMRLFYDPTSDLFKSANNWIDENWTYYSEIKQGLSEDTYKMRRLIFDENLINIKEKSIIRLLTDEVLHPFYMFQVFSIILWLADNYYYYAFCIFVISLFSIVETLLETRETMERMRKMTRFTCDIRIFRNNFWKEASSEELVPGDIFEVSDPSLSVLPCDCILLSGDCIVNESMLTGESVPVSKVAITPELTRELMYEFNKTKISQNLARSFLYNGTKIVRSRRSNSDEPSIALVVKTGFNTTKGALVRSMLFPKPTGFKFYEDSFKYIGFMTCIAGIGFIFSTINFLRLGLGWRVIILRALDLITIVVPPALPATLTIGTSFALSRLRAKNVFCIAPTRVNVGGKLDVMCFDKTGTLTEEGLDIMGVHVSQPIRDRKECEFSDLHKSVTTLFEDPNSNVVKSYFLFLAMLSCHSLKLIENELMGDPLDFKMFEFTGWDIIEDASNEELNSFLNKSKIQTNSTPMLFKSKDPLSSNEMYVQVKEFEFVSHLRRMSVIIQSYHNLNDLKVFVKGAPEVMESICRPETLPVNYNEVLHQYTHNGYRVIACATKSIKRKTKGSENDLMFLSDLSREDCEYDLDFIGFIIFENRLKPSTTAALQELSKANLRTVMCTGDNVLTAVSVGRECHLIEPGAQVYIPSFDLSIENDNTIMEQPEAEAEGEILEERVKEPALLWTEVDNPNLRLDPITLSPIGDASMINENYCLAITGDVFKYILTELEGMDFLIEKILMKGTIFARMSPDEKHELVECLRRLDYTVGFCGDGANDCGALKAADVGISLSEAEASVAAPFTSRIFEITCVLDVIKEGRASLVTSFSCFQFMSLYSAIQFVTVSILYKEGTNLGDFQFLYIDLFLIIPLAVFMSWSKPFPVLCSKRPTANLTSPKILIPLVGNILLLLAFQFFLWEYCIPTDASWYIPPIPGDDDAVQSTDNTVLFLYSNLQYIMVAVMLTVGPPYREPSSKNISFILTVIAVLLISIILMSMPTDNWFANLMDITYIPATMKFVLVGLGIVNYFTVLFGDSMVFKSIAKLYKKFFGAKESKKKFKRLNKELSTFHV